MEQKQYETNSGVFSLRNKEKYLDLDMQIDNEVTLITRNVGEHISKPKPHVSHLLLRQFDCSVIKTLGYFKESLEKFEIPIIVAKKKKSRTYWK